VTPKHIKNVSCPINTFGEVNLLYNGPEPSAEYRAIVN
jgi:hypothetical protein